MSTAISANTSIDTLSSLPRGDLAAVATYERTLGSIDGAAVSAADQRVRFASDHRRSADLFGDRATVRSLLEGEEHGLSEYENAVRTVDPDIRRVLHQELSPRQREHSSALLEIQLAIRQTS
ncbi:MAG: hypothetical protein ACYDBY_12540 [Thermoanaerobaculia bacterium]